MSSGRLFDLVTLMIAIPAVLTMQFAGGAMLDPLRDGLLEDDDGIDKKYNAEEEFAQDYEVIVKWAPMTAILGLIVLIGYREYRRQRIAARRGGF